MIGIIVCFALMLGLQLVTPYWWWIMVVPLVYGLWKGRSVWESARTGMISAGALWLMMSLYQYVAGGERLAERVGAMMGIPHGALMVILTTLLAVLAAGLAGGSGCSLRSAFVKK